jgi:hypothetical protein
MNEFTSPNTFPAPVQFLAQSRKRLECRTSTVALEDVHLRWKRRINAAAEEYRNAANQPFRFGLELNGRVMCTAAYSFRRRRRSKHACYYPTRRWQKLFGETNDGPICSCHHRSDVLYGGHGVFGRVDDVLRRFDEQDPEHAAHVDARGVSGAHDIAAVRRHTIALTRVASQSAAKVATSRARAQSRRGAVAAVQRRIRYSVIPRAALYCPPRFVIFS